MNKLVLITMVKNESDIIESFIRHHLNLVDVILVVDHNSCDTTNLILQSLRDEGLPIFIYKDSRAEKAQDKILTELMYRAINEFDADIVMPVDADEFITNTHLGHDCKKILQKFRTDTVYVIDSYNYFPESFDDEKENFILWRASLRSKIKQNLSKVIIGREVIENFHISIEMGSHNIGISRRKRKFVPHSHCDQLHIAHIQVRSKKQFISKVAVGWISGLARPNRTTTDSFHLKKSFEKLKSGANLNYNEMINTISDLQLEKNDIEPSFIKKRSIYTHIKYDSLISIDPMTNILNTGESIAIKYAEAIRRESDLFFLLKRIAISFFEKLQFIYYRQIKGITNW